MAIWQIASGDSGRDYSRFLINHDLMLVGPGDPGAYDPELYHRAVNAGLLSAKKQGALAQFHSEVKAGELVLLRKGHHVVSIGVVAAEGYSWDDRYDDVHGWDLQHTRRVYWQDHLEPDLASLQTVTQPLFADRKQIPMFTRVSDEKVLAPIRSLLSQVQERTLRKVPEPPTEILDDSGLGRELFSRGLSNRATEDVLSALQRQRRLHEWYVEHGRSSRRPAEHEVVAHMVLPLFLALGWSEQLLAVEWNRIDLAGFASAPTTTTNCSLVCEAKGRGHGLSGVLAQAKRYVHQLKLTQCRQILLTDGGRYYLYARDNEDWPDEPSSYLNAAKPRCRYVDGTSAISALLELRSGQLPTAPWAKDQ